MDSSDNVDEYSSTSHKKQCVVNLYSASMKSYQYRNFDISENIYGKCSKISNTLKLRTPKIIAENNF